MRLVILPFLIFVTFFVAAQAAELPWENPTEDEMALLKKGLVEASNLKDPFSVQFRDGVRVRAFEGNRVFCGHLNAKNSLGAFTGWTKFAVANLVIGEDGGRWMIGIADGSEFSAALIDMLCKDFSW